jgi:hypothetical protein
MEEPTMLIWLAVTGAATGAAYWWTRSFVRNRLRFVDAVQRPAAPLIAGAATAALAVPAAGLLPVLTLASGVVIAAGVAAAVAHGRADPARLPQP